MASWGVPEPQVPKSDQIVVTLLSTDPEDIQTKNAKNKDVTSNKASEIFIPTSSYKNLELHLLSEDDSVHLTHVHDEGEDLVLTNKPDTLFKPKRSTCRDIQSKYSDWRVSVAERYSEHSDVPTFYQIAQEIPHKVSEVCHVSWMKLKLMVVCVARY